MRFLVIGDTHGKVRDIALIDEWASRNNIQYIIQVGDFGASWPDPPQPCKILHYFTKRERQNRSGPLWLVVLGNHDNWNKFGKLSLNPEFKDSPLIPYAPGLLVARRPAYVPFIDTLFCGGAVSTDAHNRKINKSWWKNEAPSREELELFFDMMETHKPRYVISHDGPEIAHQSRGDKVNPLSLLPSNYVSRAFQNVLELSSHKPESWFFGHHHTFSVTKTDSTTFYCSGLHGQGYLVLGSKAIPFDVKRGLDL